MRAGPEPDFRWQAFANAVAELAVALQVRLMVGLGGFPAGAPHTRPVKLALKGSGLLGKHPAGSGWLESGRNSLLESAQEATLTSVPTSAFPRQCSEFAKAALRSGLTSCFTCGAAEAMELRAVARLGEKGRLGSWYPTHPR